MTSPPSLDGCVADEDGNFDWAEPDEEVHAFVNDLQPAGRHPLYHEVGGGLVARWRSRPGSAKS